MKHTAARRILAITALMIYCVTALASGASAQGITFAEWKDRLLNVQSFKFQRRKVGTHVGYIPPKYTRAKGFKSSMAQKKFDNLSAVAADAIEVTDNPLKAGTSFWTLNAGDAFRLLAKYTYNGNWWYIEFTADGQEARGFIDRTASFFRPGDDVEGAADMEAMNLASLGMPDKSPADTEQIGEIRINGTEKDERKRVHKDSNLDSKWISVVYPTRTYPCYGTKETKQRTFYYIFVEEDSAWGWVVSDYSTYTAK